MHYNRYRYYGHIYQPGPDRVSGWAESVSICTKIYLIGKAKSEDIMASGRNRRENRSEQLAWKAGYKDAVARPYKAPGDTTTGKAKRVEAKEVRKLRNDGHELPLNKERQKYYKANSCKKGLKNFK